MVSPTFPVRLELTYYRHSHEFEVKSGMLILPTPPGMVESVWEMAETEAMKEVMGLYGKTWHFWQVDKGDELPLGYPKLMGSFTNNDQIDLNQALSGRDNRYGVDHKVKAKKREHIDGPGVHESKQYPI